MATNNEDNGLGSWSSTEQGDKLDSNMTGIGGDDYELGTGVDDAYSIPSFQGGSDGREAEIAKLLGEKMKGGKGAKINGVRIISKENNPGLKYSVLAVTALNETSGKTIFYTISLDDGSAGIITPDSMITQAQTKQYDSKQSKQIFFPTDYIDASLATIVASSIGDRDALHVGSILLGNKDLDIEKIIPALAKETFKCIVAAQKALGEYGNMTFNIKSLENQRLRCSITHTTGVNNDLSGRKSSPTFNIQLDDANTSQLTYGQLNTQGGTAHVTVKGRINFIPVKLEQGGFMACPDICISTLDTKDYTPEYMLLGLVAANEMIAMDRWITNVVQTGYNVGNLNTIINMAGVEKPSSIDIFDKASPEISAARVMGLVKGHRFISISAKSHGENNTLLRLLVDAATGNANARRTIVEAAHNLTNGAFDINYNLDAIFHPTFTRLPDGMLSDGRTCDAFGILDVLNNPNFTEIDYSTETAAITGNGDTIANRSVAIVSTGLTADYTGVIDLVRFEPAFIKALSTAAGSTGLKYSMNDNGIAVQNTGLEFTQQLFAGVVHGNVGVSGTLGVNMNGMGSMHMGHRTTMQYFG